MRRILFAAMVAVLAAFAVADPGSTTADDCYTGTVLNGDLQAPVVEARAVPYPGNDPRDFSVLVEWTGAAGAHCYVIEQYIGHLTPDADDFAFHAAVSPQQTEYTVQGPFESGSPSHFYRVYAAGAFARSAYSNEAYVSFIAVDTVPPTPTQIPGLERGDLNCDGVVDARDALPVLKEAAEVDADLPVGCPSLNEEVGIATQAGVAAGVIGLVGAGFLATRRRRSRAP